MDPIDEAVAANVRAALARRRLTATAIAEATGIKAATLSRRLSGKSPFDIRELAQIAAAIECPVEDLVKVPAA